MSAIVQQNVKLTEWSTNCVIKCNRPLVSTGKFRCRDHEENDLVCCVTTIASEISMFGKRRKWDVVFQFDERLCSFVVATLVYYWKHTNVRVRSTN